MAEFEVKVYPLIIEEHPDADALELAVVGNYKAIVRKGEYQDGDLAAYIPEAAIVPADILEEMNLTGKLAGKDGNRVKAIKLRGVVSQGLIYRPSFPIAVGDDVTERLGITKYEPPIPESMAGQVWNAMGKTLKYDIENIKKYPQVLSEGEEVVMTEKIHGTFCQMGFCEGEPVVSSKGLAGRGQAFKVNEANATNLYVRRSLEYASALTQLAERYGMSIYVCGEIYGAGVQDLKYDLTDKAFRVFDVYVGVPGQGRFMDYDEMVAAVGVDFDVVPLIYRGPFRAAELAGLSRGQSTIAAHMREGVVIKPVQERRDMELGRVILKSVSDDYLLRKGGTEFE